MFFNKVSEHRRLVDHTVKLVQIAYNDHEKGNNAGFLYMILGIPPCIVSYRSGQPHNYKAVVDAIHLFQKRNPNKNVMEPYYYVMSEVANAFYNFKGFNLLVAYLRCELEKSKLKTNSFDFDFDLFINKIEITITKLKDSDKINDYMRDDMLEDLALLKKDIAEFRERNKFADDLKKYRYE